MLELNPKTPKSYQGPEPHTLDLKTSNPKTSDPEPKNHKPELTTLGVILGLEKLAPRKFIIPYNPKSPIL